MCQPVLLFPHLTHNRNIIMTCGKFWCVPFLIKKYSYAYDSHMTLAGQTTAILLLPLVIYLSWVHVILMGLGEGQDAYCPADYTWCGSFLGLHPLLQHLLSEPVAHVICNSPISHLWHISLRLESITVCCSYLSWSPQTQSAGKMSNIHITIPIEMYVTYFNMIIWGFSWSTIT